MCLTSPTPAASLSDEPLTDKEICKLMRLVEDQRKADGKVPLVEFLPAARATARTVRRRLASALPRSGLKPPKAADDEKKDAGLPDKSGRDPHKPGQSPALHFKHRNRTSEAKAFTP